MGAAVHAPGRSAPRILPGVLGFVLAACVASCSDSAPAIKDTPATAGTPDSARQAFAREMSGMLLDTQVHELRGHLSVKARNTNPNDPEAPLVDRPVEHPVDPGPHTSLGVMHAEIGALRAVLGDALPVSIEDDRVFVGRPEVLVLGHRHGEHLYVPVRLFARPYGAYVRTHCPLANCADIWPREILLYMRNAGYLHSAGVLEGYLEGLLDSVNVRKLPSGW
ncbi:MAG TPA: hypothetical protein VFZ73_05130 [Gemmatimonadaceae bacterium]